MKHLTLLILFLFLVGCNSTPKKTEPMEGAPIGGQMEAYKKMCERPETNPILCPDSK